MTRRNPYGSVWEYVAAGVLIVGFVTLLALVVSLSLADDWTEWVETEDPDCVMKIEHVREFLGDHAEVRNRYCKEAR